MLKLIVDARVKPGRNAADAARSRQFRSIDIRR
jgi:hypothetical protein